MRIVHVSDCYPPRTGGIESQVSDLARHQAAAGHEVHVLTATRGPGGERGAQDDHGVQVHRLAMRLPLDIPVNPLAAPHMRAVLDAVQPDVVHVHAGLVSPVAYDGARVALRAGVPVAITWHCMLDGMVSVLRLGVRATAWRRAPVALSAVSRAAAARVATVFGAPVHVVPNGLDIADWLPEGPLSEDGDDGEPDPLRLVATMRLAPRKRAVQLIDLVGAAAARLGPRAPRLTVIGDGPVRPLVERRIDRAGLADRVELRGRLPRAEVRRAYSAADVFLAPAALEAFGIAVLEARTAGLAVVARRGTGIEDYITHEKDGLLVADDAEMTAAIVRLAAEPGLLGRIRRHNRTHAPALGWDDVLAAAEREYHRARGLRRHA